MRCFQYFLMAFMQVFGFESLAAEAVKKTVSGICHPPASSYYERTKDFITFGSLDQCLDSGGRLPRQLAAQHSNYRTQDDSQSYERSAFGHGWDDTDGDCQDSRAEALIATSSTPVRFAGDKRCRVVAGRWISPFTGNVIQNSGDIDIDHVVPLKWAWNRGAKGWSHAKRERFANDIVNLWPVELSLNIQGCSRPRRVVASSWTMQLRVEVSAHREAVCSSAFCIRNKMDNVFS